MKALRTFHVLVEWPDGRRPWLVLIDAPSEAYARLVVEMSDDVRLSEGEVVSVKDVTKEL